MNVFNTRDIDGNESAGEGYSSTGSSNIDAELSIPITLNSIPLSELSDTPDEDTPLHIKTRMALEFFDSINLKTYDFLDGLSWGDTPCIQDAKIRAERTRLFQSSQLPKILQRWAVPPRQPGSSHARATGGSAVMNNFSIQNVCRIVDQELEAMAKYLKSPTSEDIDKETLTSTSFENLSSEMDSTTPVLSKLLNDLAYCDGQRERNTHKTPQKMIILIVSMLSYSRSHHRNRVQKLMAIYLKFKGISAKGFDTLHAMGITMSHKWTCDVVERISEKCLAEVRDMVDKIPSFISYDNMQVPFRVFSQRLDNNGEFGNGTAATVYFNRNAKPLPTDINKRLQKHRAHGQQNPLTELALMDLAVSSSPHLRPHAEYYVLRILLDCPEFNLATYGAKGSEYFSPPTPRKALPCGPEHRTLQYMLGTVNVAEASYEDNERLIHEWLGQLGWGTPEEQQKTGRDRVVTWCGDQLTMDRLRGLFKYHAEDDNSYERLDFSLLVLVHQHFQIWSP